MCPEIGAKETTIGGRQGAACRQNNIAAMPETSQRQCFFKFQQQGCINPSPASGNQPLLSLPRAAARPPAPTTAISTVSTVPEPPAAPATWPPTLPGAGAPSQARSRSSAETTGSAEPLELPEGPVVIVQMQPPLESTWRVISALPGAPLRTTSTRQSPPALRPSAAINNWLGSAEIERVSVAEAIPAPINPAAAIAAIICEVTWLTPETRF